jgi:hypothetical protein
MFLKTKVLNLKKPLKVKRVEMVEVQHHHQHHHLRLVQDVLVERHRVRDQVVQHRFDQVLEVVLQFVLEVLRHRAHQLRHLHQVHRVDQVEQQLQLRRLHVRVLRNRQKEFKS